MECTSTTTNACSNLRWKSYPLSAFFLIIFACLIMVKGKMQKRSSEVEDFYILVRELMSDGDSYELRQKNWRYWLQYLGLSGMHATGTCLTKNNLNLLTFCKERCHYCRNTRDYVNRGIPCGVNKASTHAHAGYWLDWLYMTSQRPNNVM